MEEKTAPDFSSMARSWARQSQMPAWKPSSVRRRKRHSMGLSRQSISAQAASDERLGHIRLSNKLGLSARAGRTLAARSDSATMDRACRSCPNDPQSHIVLHRRRSVAAHAAKKEYTFPIDLGIEFLFHSVDPE